MSASDLLSKALRCISLNWYIFPGVLGTKQPDLALAPHWSTDSSNDRDVVTKWWTEKPEAPICIDLGRSNLTVLDFDNGSVPLELGLPESFEVTTGRGTHYYALGTSKQNKIYLNGQHVGELKSSGGYVLGPTSTHPSGAIYKANNKPFVAVGSIARIIASLTKEPLKSEQQPHEPKKLIPHGEIHGAMMSYAGKLRETLGLDFEDIESLLLKWVHQECQPPIDDSKVSAAARSICNYEKGDTRSYVYNSANQPQSDEILDVDDSTQTQDMPSNTIPDCLLGTIAREYMGHMPLAYSLPALLTVAGTMIPRVQRTTNEIIAASAGAGSQTNLYTALIGDVGSGKTQAIIHAVGNMGLSHLNYDSTKAGSAEGLFKKIAARTSMEPLGTARMLINLDEWAHFFKKAGIENSSFVENLNSAFNSPEVPLVIAKGESINLNVALSFIGGIVTDGVQSCFGSESTTGFYDRFLFGISPSSNAGEYRPFERSQSAQDSVFDKPEDPARVKIDRSVWELVTQWKKADLSLGRETEVTVRCCSIIASFDGRSTITAKDLEAMRPFMDYQVWCRQIVQPTAGVTVDAKVCNSILGYLKKHADQGQWINQRSLKRGIHNRLEELGSGAFRNALTNLVAIHAIQIKSHPNPHGEPTHLIRLLKGM